MSATAGRLQGVADPRSTSLRSAESRSARRLVVIGGDAAGMSAASQARRRLGPTALEIVALERGPDTSYSACGIPYWIGDVVPDRDALIARPPQVFRSDQDIDVRLRTEVVEIDTGRRAVVAHELDGDRRYSLTYDELLIATGALPVRPPIPGADGPGVFRVHTLADGEGLRAALAGGRVHGVAIVGGGYVGLETAEQIAARGFAVTIVDQAPAPMVSLDPDMSEQVATAIKKAGIELVTGDGLAEIVHDGDGGVTGVVTASGRTIPAQLVVLALGVRPNAALAATADIPLGPTGAIAVDRRMATRTPHVWAAGDCAESRHVITGGPVAVALGTHANKQGRVAGDNIAGAYAAFPGVLGTAATKVCSAEIARTGLSSQEAREAGFEIVTTVVDSTTRASYFPGSAPIRVKLIAESGTGRLLGGQIVGSDGSAKRIDVLATAIWNAMTAEQFFAVDLSYAPPFSPVWDPVVIAARKLHDAVRADARRGGGPD